MTSVRPMRERLLSRLIVDLDGLRPVDDAPCWIWQGKTRNGYGRISREGGRGAPRVDAHVAAYELYRGPVPAGLQIDHLCRVRACCNPAHMEAVPQRINILRGQSPIANNARKTHCPAGHPYDEQNTGHYKSGRRCRTCARLHMQRTRAALR